MRDCLGQKRNLRLKLIKQTVIIQTPELFQDVLVVCLQQNRHLRVLRLRRVKVEVLPYSAKKLVILVEKPLYPRMMNYGLTKMSPRDADLPAGLLIDEHLAFPRIDHAGRPHYARLIRYLLQIVQKVQIILKSAW